MNSLLIFGECAVDIKGMEREHEKNITARTAGKKWFHFKFFDERHFIVIATLEFGWNRDGIRYTRSGVLKAKRRHSRATQQIWMGNVARIFKIKMGLTLIPNGCSPLAFAVEAKGIRPITRMEISFNHFYYRQICENAKEYKKWAEKNYEVIRKSPKFKGKNCKLPWSNSNNFFSSFFRMGNKKSFIAINSEFHIFF